MQYQRKTKTIENQQQEKPLDIRNIKKVIKNSKLENQSFTQKITTKPININTKSTDKREITKNDNIKRVSYTKTEKQYKNIQSPSIMESRPSNYKVNISSKYHIRAQNETSPIFKEQISGIEDTDYNIHTLNARKSPDNNSYGGNSIENEKPIRVKNNSQYTTNLLFDNPQILDQETFKTYTNESIKINNSTFNTNVKSYRPPMIPQNKMSPIQNYDDGNSSYENKRYNEKKNRYTNYLTNTNPNSSGNENLNLNISNIPRVGRNTLGRTGTGGNFLTDLNSPSYNNERKNSQNSNHVSKKELKNIVKKFNKVYDPYRNEKGLLIKQSQVTLPGASDEIFNNRYRVLSKMNKLSNILLAKQKKYDEDNFSSGGNSRDNTSNIYERDRSFNKFTNSKNKYVKKNKKLSLVSLAMMAGKAPNTEDRTILRKNRIEKGGVVDLAQEEIKKNKFKIKKATKVSGNTNIIKTNPKYREKAAKIIQAWWKELKDIYNYKLAQIIKIQSIWKGRWVRRNIYDLLYLNYLYLSFCEKIEKVLTEKMTRYALDKLIMHQKSLQAIDKNKLKGLVIKADKKRLMILKKYWDYWIKILQYDKMKKNKGKNLIQIRADKENKLGKLRTAFTIWKFNTKIDNIKKKYIYRNEDDKEEYNSIRKKIINIKKVSERKKYISPDRKDDVIEKDKFRGLLLILDGVNNYHKKQAYDATKPKIIKYLNKIAKQEKLRNLIYKKKTKIIYILKKTIYKWLTKTIKIISYSDKENVDTKKDTYNLKTKMFLRRIENVKNKQKKIILRKYFYKYLKTVLKMGKQEERQKLLDLYKNDTNEYNNNFTYNSEQNDLKKDSGFSLSAYARKRNKKNKVKYQNSAFIKRIGDTLEGSKILEKFMWRHTYGNVLECFINKLDNEILNIYMLKIIKIKEKITQNILKSYLDKWKNNTILKKTDDLKSKLFIKIIKIIIENNKKKILSKKLYQWQKIVHILNGTENIFLKSKNTYEFMEHIKKFISKKYVPFFTSRLKEIKKEISSIYYFKKIIHKQNNKNNQLLLKNAINKWKNKVSGYEIGKLKGKLLLKIYDKYKSTKTKDILKKFLSKWENNTIFLDKIKNKINKENIDTFNKETNKEKIIIILKSIIRNLNRKNNNMKLRKYFNKWRKNIQDKNKIL